MKDTPGGKCIFAKQYSAAWTRSLNGMEGSLKTLDGYAQYVEGGRALPPSKRSSAKN